MIFPEGFVYDTPQTVPFRSTCHLQNRSSLTGLTCWTVGIAKDNRIEIIGRSPLSGCLYQFKYVIKRRGIIPPTLG
jgi:RimJ/RimL family protein N-acetyltransferase